MRTYTTFISIILEVQTMRQTKQTSVEQILNMSSKQISKLSDADLRKIVVIANSAANKIIKRAEKAGLTSGVIDRAKENGKFSVKGVENRIQLENAFTNVKNFLSAQTSSVAGIKKQQRKMFKNLAKVVNKELPPEEQINLSGQNEADLKNISGLIWQQIDKLSERKSLGITSSERYKLAAHAYNVTTRDRRPIQTKTGLFKNLEKYYKQMYEKSLEDPGLDNMTVGEQKISEIYNNID